MSSYSFKTTLCLSLTLGACAPGSDASISDWDTASDTGALDAESLPDVEDLPEAGKTTTYSTTYATSYATTNYAGGYYASGYWHDYSKSGGNCANFVSQAIVAGLAGTSSASTAYSKRTSYMSDKGSTYQWYWNTTADYGSAFINANSLYKYAKNNLSTYKGMHFTYVTNDTTTAYMDPTKVKKGDIVFMDWEADGTFDHVMIVTKIDSTATTSDGSNYNIVRLTGQTTNEKNTGMGDINAEYDYSALFYVYRPTDYSTTGL